MSSITTESVPATGAVSDSASAPKGLTPLGRIISDDQHIEVRALKPGSPPVSKRFGPARRREMLSEVARLEKDGYEVYFTLNPLLPGTKGPAKDAMVERRRLLLIDCDPERDADAKKAAGDGAKLSATDAEKVHAIRMAGDIRDHLMTAGWPDPVEADSGNGSHLLYPIDLPNDDESRALVKSVLEALAMRFDTADATVDTTVHNASRITKFYGTKSRKGEPTAERPHRRSMIVVQPDEFGQEAVPLECLQALAASIPTPVIEPGPVQEPPRTRKPSGGGRWTPEARAVAYLEKCDPSISGSKGHNQTFKTACKVGPGFDLSPDVALVLLREVFNPECKPPWSEAELRHKVDQAYKVETKRGWLLDADREKQGKAEKKRASQAASTSPEAEVKPSRVVEKIPVEINTQRHKVADQSIKALGNDPDLFRRGNMLVTVAREDEDLTHLTTRTVIERVKGTPKIVSLSEAVIGERLTKHVEFYQWRKDNKGEDIAVPAHPPDWLIKIVATRKGDWPGIRNLVAVAECPYPRPDGSIVEEPGYDAKTAVLYAPSIAFLPVPKNPTQDEARAAAARIYHYARFFPFPSDEDRSVFLAGMLGVIARHGIIGPMPGIAVNGNKAGIGKGYLVDGMVIPGTGRVAPLSKYPHDPAEAGKVKTTIVRSGKTIVSFDNLKEGTRYGGEDVDSLLTAKVTDDRVLGLSENTGELIVRLVCFVNGNNIEPVSDAYRRWLVCNLVTQLDHPERRKIVDEAGKPVPEVDVMVMENRAEIVKDCLTILRAHALAGRPNGGWAPLGSFGHWDEVVRGAVWFATGFDCVATQHRASEESSDRRDKMALLEGWWELPEGKFGERGITSHEALALVGSEAERDEYQTLRNALLQRGSKGKLPDSRLLGAILKGLANTPVGGFKLLKHPTLRHKAVAWYVQRSEDSQSCDDDGGVRGSGESIPAAALGACNITPHVMMSESKSNSREVVTESDSLDSPDSPPRAKVWVAEDEWTNAAGIWDAAS